MVASRLVPLGPSLSMTSASREVLIGGGPALHKGPALPRWKVCMVFASRAEPWAQSSPIPEVCPMAPPQRPTSPVQQLENHQTRPKTALPVKPRARGFWRGRLFVGQAIVFRGLPSSSTHNALRTCYTKHRMVFNHPALRTSCLPTGRQAPAVIPCLRFAALGGTHTPTQ